MSDSNKKCQCGEPSTHSCANCKKPVCDDCNCGTDTVEGYLCGTYTQWGCARKYTNCDACESDKAIHEGDFIVCDDCNEAQCEECAAKNFIECSNCGIMHCTSCADDHKDDCNS